MTNTVTEKKVFYQGSGEERTRHVVEIERPMTPDEIIKAKISELKSKLVDGSITEQEREDLKLLLTPF